MLSQEALQSDQVLLVNHFGCKHERALLIGEHVYCLDDVAHLTILEPLSVLNLHHDVLPGSLLIL